LDSLYEVPQKKVDSIFEENAKEFKSLILTILIALVIFTLSFI